MTIDLTTLTLPLGGYDIETKGRLIDAWHNGGVIECHYLTDVFQEITWPTWGADVVYRLRPKPLRDMVVAPELWRALGREWRWVARDEDGEIWAYSFKPVTKRIQWCGEDEEGLRLLPNFFAPGLIDPGTKPWDQSLIERPDDV